MEKVIRQITRREFGKGTGLGLLSGLLAMVPGWGGCADSRKSAAPHPRKLLRNLRAEGHSFFALLCDTHIHDKTVRPDYPDGYPSADYTAQRLRSAIDQIHRFPIPLDFVLFGGDLTDYSLDGEWDHFFEIVSELKIPFHLTLGNHDHDDWDSAQWPRIAAALEKGIRSLPLCRTPLEAIREDGLYYTAEEKNWRLLVLDTLQSGDISSPQRQWLENVLQDHSRPTIVSMHRPIVSVGNWVDDARFRDKHAIRLLLNTPSLKAFVSGHTHRARTWYYLDAIHAVAPSLAYGIGDGLGFRILGRDQENIIITCSEYVDDSCRMCIGRKTAKELIIDPAEIYEYDPLYNPLSLPRRLYGKTNETVNVPANRYLK